MYGLFTYIKHDFENARVEIIDSETVNVFVDMAYEDEVSAVVQYTLKKNENTELGWQIDFIQEVFTWGDIVTVDFENSHF